MNCSDVQKILNDATRDNPSAAEREKLHAHLAGCATCDAEWQAQALLAVMPVAPASTDLRSLAQTVLRAPVAGSRRAATRPVVVLAGVALVGAAAFAAWVGITLEQTEDASATASAQSASIDAAAEIPAAREENEAEAAPASPASAADDVERSADAPGIVLDRSWIAVLPLPSNYEDREVLAKVNELRTEIVNRIGAMEGLNLFELSRLQTYVDAGMTDLEIGRALGAGVVLFPKITRGPRGNVEIQFTKLDPATEREIHGASFIVLVANANATEAQIQSFDRANALTWENNLSVILNVVYTEAFPELTPSPEQMAAENRQILFDTGRSEEERLEALQYFNTYLGGVDAAGVDVVDAGVRLLENSSSPQIRNRVLYALGDVSDPRLVPSLSRLLAYDTDVAVRRLSASMLAKFSDDPDVRELLELAEANDADPSVREAAAVAKLPAAERMQHRRDVFFNEDLSPVERLMELNIGFSSSSGESPIEMDQEIARELVDIAVNGPSPDDQALALTVLYYVGSYFPDFEPDPALRLPLLDMLENDPEQGMRGAAAHALRIFTDEPDIRAALENARDNSPDRQTRNAAAHALDPGP